MALIRKYLLLGLNFYKKEKLNEYDLYLLDELTDKKNENVSVSLIKSVAQTKWEKDYDGLKKDYKLKNKEVLEYIEKKDNANLKGFDFFYQEQKNLYKNEKIKNIKKTGINYLRSQNQNITKNQ